MKTTIVNGINATDEQVKSTIDTLSEETRTQYKDIAKKAMNAFKDVFPDMKHFWFEKQDGFACELTDLLS